LKPGASRWIRVLAALALSVAPGLGAAELRPFSATFGVIWHGLSAGQSRVELLRLPDGRWSYSSRNEPRGLFRLAMPRELSSRSIFIIRDGQIVPERFTGDDGTAATQRDSDLQFDWVRGRVTGIAETRKVDLPLQPGMHDSMSVQVALMHELLAGRTPSHFVMLDKDKIKEYVYTQEGSETLQTVLGPRHTVLFRSARPGSQNGTWFWCAPDLGYLPVKVERRNGGKVEWSMTLLKATVAGQPCCSTPGDAAAPAP
jgi:hypothetical protein